jgi:hypothetical protein
MENYPIIIQAGKKLHRFEIGEFLHDDGENCEIRVPVCREFSTGLPSVSPNLPEPGEFR